MSWASRGVPGPAEAPSARSRRPPLLTSFLALLQVFSALYVQLLSLSWEPLPSWINSRPVLSTGIVRVLALAIGILAANLTNFALSAPFVRHIIVMRLYYIEKRIWTSCESVRGVSAWLFVVQSCSCSRVAVVVVV